MLADTHPLSRALSGLVLASLWLLAASAVATTGDVVQPAAPLDGAGANLDQEKPFTYVMEGRPDPFVPFIRPKVATAQLNPDEIIEEDVELTGMRKFEPGQLTLVAVMTTPEKKFAMVEDVTGKGYVITEGMGIGRHGTVTRIDPGQVLVTEIAHTRAHKEIKNTIVMRLNKEGEK